MKNNLQNIKTKIKRFRFFLISLLVSVFILNCNLTHSQNTKSPASKLTFDMNLSYLLSNDIRNVKVVLTRYEKGRTIPVDNLSSPIYLYLNGVKEFDPADGTGLIGKMYIDKEGEGMFEFPSKLSKVTSGLHNFTFTAKLDSDKLYENVEKEISISDAKVSIEYSGDDSIKTVTAYLYEWKGTAFIPVPEAELKLCIKRTFNFLPFGESGISTDENGKISGILPLDVIGNADHTLTIAARLEDHETFGTLEITKFVPWTVLPRTNPERGRTLWSQGDNAPLLLVFSSVIIIVIIWGAIIYLIFLLIKIKKLGKMS